MTIWRRQLLEWITGADRFSRESDTPGDLAGPTPHLLRPRPPAREPARAKAVRELILEEPELDRLYLLSQVVWPSPTLEAYYAEASP